MEAFLKFFLILALASIFVREGACHVAAQTPPEAYWKSIFGTLPMPKPIFESLQKQANQDADRKFAGEAYNINDEYVNEAKQAMLEHNTGSLLFLKKQLFAGNKISMDFKYHLEKCKQDLTSFPSYGTNNKVTPSFSSNNLPELLRSYSVNPTSMTADIMKTTLTRCEKFNFVNGANQFCANSMESLVDSVVSSLRKSETKDQIKAIWATTTPTDPSKTYQLVGIRQLAVGKPLLSCHKLTFPYAIFYCHQPQSTEAYSISLQGVEDGVQTKAYALCHTDTSDWNPRNAAFQLLREKPGAAVCHFLQYSDVVWFSSS